MPQLWVAPRQPYRVVRFSLALMEPLIPTDHVTHEMAHDPLDAAAIRALFRVDRKPSRKRFVGAFHRDESHGQHRSRIKAADIPGQQIGLFDRQVWRKDRSQMFPPAELLI